MTYATITQLNQPMSNDKITPDTTSTEAIFGGKSVTPVYGFVRRDSLRPDQILRVGVSDRTPISNFSEVAYAFKDLVGDRILPMGRVNMRKTPIGQEAGSYRNEEEKRVDHWQEITRKLARESSAGLNEYSRKSIRARRAEAAQVEADWLRINRNLAREVNAPFYAEYGDVSPNAESATPVAPIINIRDIVKQSIKYAAAAVVLACAGLGGYVSSHQSLSPPAIHNETHAKPSGLEKMLASVQFGQ